MATGRTLDYAQALSGAQAHWQPAPRTARRAVKANGNGAASRADQLAELVRRKPGMTVRQAAEQLGVKDATSLYRPIRRLEDAGELRRTKGKLEPLK